MKTFKHIMGIFILLILLTARNYAQNKNETIFLRVYTLEGKKITGNIYSINDSLLVLKRGDKEFSITPNSIKTIKTKRSGGANILIGVGIGALVGGLVGNSQGDDEPGLFSYSKEDYTLIYGLTGAAIGGAVGALTLTGKKSKKYRINGDLEKWKLFLEDMK